MDSDESDFYGDEDLVKDLEGKVDNFDVNKWWQDHEVLETPLKTQARGEPLATVQYHNPYAGHPYAWQLSESVNEFLARLPPATTKETPDCSWIWICNPYIKRKSKSEAENQQVRGGEDEAPEDEGADVATLVKAGQERLQFASSFIDQFREIGLLNAQTVQESKKAGMDAAKEILDLAKVLRVTCGKWMVFCAAFEVNDVWEIIAKATAKNELGIAAKVAPNSGGDQRRERLICVYTADFSDKKDVTRVAQRLKQLGLVKSRPLYYKPDAYTYLGIGSVNPWGIRASIYDTRSLLSK
ncbi:hypothetical protein GGS24DRAFT_297092 [Hypoxylon argillaceum]|nr:hypothetical protein GGS24DRAFT_297092 [Hypoxylon argillaceum]